MGDFVTIAAFDDYVTANFELQKLEAMGMTCYLADENTVTMQWTLSNAMGGIKLRVLESDVEKARQILNEKPEELTADHTIEDSDLKCPNCGSNNTVEEKYSKSVFVASLLILGFPISVNPIKSCRCFYCGHVWKI